jgi:hypothetical protein
MVWCITYVYQGPVVAVQKKVADHHTSQMGVNIVCVLL